jgi:hypothetical protein
VEQIVTLALWPAVGLVAWWASSSSDRARPRWLLINLILGPLMLVPLAWRYVADAERGRRT